MNHILGSKKSKTTSPNEELATDGSSTGQPIEAIKCPNCGHVNSSEFQFCASCGKFFSWKFPINRWDIILFALIWDLMILNAVIISLSTVVLMASIIVGLDVAKLILFVEVAYRSELRRRKELQLPPASTLFAFRTSTWRLMPWRGNWKERLDLEILLATLSFFVAIPIAIIDLVLSSICIVVLAFYFKLELYLYNTIGLFRFLLVLLPLPIYLYYRNRQIKRARENWEKNQQIDQVPS
ncbi:MAG: zinc ribbon domain-containing protein [Promethearchaeota archaeon]